MDFIRRASQSITMDLTKASDMSSKANHTMDMLTELRKLVDMHRKMQETMAQFSLARKRWNDAIRRVLLIIQKEKVKAHLVKLKVILPTELHPIFNSITSTDVSMDPTLSVMLDERLVIDSPIATPISNTAKALSRPTSAIPGSQSKSRPTTANRANRGVVSTPSPADRRRSSGNLTTMNNITASRKNSLTTTTNANIIAENKRQNSLPAVKRVGGGSTEDNSGVNKATKPVRAASMNASSRRNSETVGKVVTSVVPLPNIPS